MTLTILACWTVSTYFHRLFPAFARLFLTGEAESGKSKAPQIIAGLAFNGLYRVTPNGPPLFRLIDALRPTYCISEAENLDGEQRQVLQAILNEGYLRGGYVDRCDKEGNWEPRPFEVFAPITMGNVKGIRGVMVSRTIPLVLVRGTDQAKLNADVDPESPPFRAARGLLYRLALERFQEVAEAWSTLPTPGWLVARERQLWRPLLVIATLADREASAALTLVDTLTEAARRQTRDRSAPSEEAAALVTILKGRLQGAEEIRLQPGDLVDDLKSKLHAGAVSSRGGRSSPPPDRIATLVSMVPSLASEVLRERRAALVPRQPTIGPAVPSYNPFGPPWDADALAEPDIDPGDLLGIGKAIGLLAAKLATPSALGLLKLLDVSARRAAPLARARIAKVLEDLRFHDSGRIWQFMERRPRLVEVGTVPRMPTPPGARGTVLGETAIPPALEQPISVILSRHSPDRAATLAHEMITAGTGLAGREAETFPGLVPSYVGHVQFSQRYPRGDWGPEYFPTLFDNPDWITLVDRQRVLDALDQWYPKAEGALTLPTGSRIPLSPLTGGR